MAWKDRKPLVEDSTDGSCHNRPTPMSLPFLLELYAEVEKSWKRLYSARIYLFQHSNYLRVEGLSEWGYVRMHPIEETLTGYLSQADASSLKAPSLPSEPLRTTSCLNENGRAQNERAAGRSA